MAVDMYLEIPEIKGKSQKKGYEEQMDIVSFSDGVLQHTSFGVLRQGRRQRQGRISGHPHRQICRQGFEPVVESLREPPALRQGNGPLREAR